MDSPDEKTADLWALQHHGLNDSGHCSTPFSPSQPQYSSQHVYTQQFASQWPLTQSSFDSGYAHSSNAFPRCFSQEESSNYFHTDPYAQSFAQLAYQNDSFASQQFYPSQYPQSQQYPAFSSETQLTSFAPVSACVQPSHYEQYWYQHHGAPAYQPADSAANAFQSAAALSEVFAGLENLSLSDDRKPGHADSQLLRSPRSTNSIQRSPHHQKVADLLPFAPVLTFSKDLPPVAEATGPAFCPDSPANEDFYQHVARYQQQLLPVVEAFQAYLDEHLETFTPEQVVDKLKQLRQSFSSQQPFKAKSRISQKKAPCRKIAAPQVGQLIASPEFLDLIQNPKEKEAKTEWKYRDVVTARAPRFASFVANVGLVYGSRKCKETSSSDKEAICSLIRIIIESLEQGTVHTERGLYYRNVQLFKSSAHLSQLIRDICVTTSLARAHLNIISSPKGVFAGQVLLMERGGDSPVNGENSGGVLVPSEPAHIRVLSCGAKFILLIEKYATFFQLLSARVPQRLGCIMITGCGYPDVRTRAFLQKLWLSQKLPVFALVDGDAYGIEIMCTYRYGSLAMAYESLHMNVPDIKWLGIQADDIVAFRLQGSRFTDRELRRFATLKKRPYLQGDHPWLEQIVLMEKLGIKVEIQALHDYSPDFLPDVYLPYKIMYGSWK